MSVSSSPLRIKGMPTILAPDLKSIPLVWLDMPTASLFSHIIWLVQMKYATSVSFLPPYFIKLTNYTLKHLCSYMYMHHFSNFPF